MDKFQAGILGVFTLLAIGLLALAGLDLIIEGHLPVMQIALGGGLLVLTIGSQLMSDG
ncbi:MAG: hypothetical protein NW224_03270 [Leptolyngbyaceae cyanobacterium bins.302]|nr:hypothetical protein [Leptolyngbyaceae cyanobacterium bins.302]